MRISVFIPSYNQKDLLKQAIDSVLEQTLKPYEIIIVDDGSSDGSQEFISSYKQRYPELIRPIFHEKNTGVTQTRIDALRAVRGDYVSYVDGDDLWMPSKLEKEARLLEGGRYDLAFSNTAYFSKNPLNVERIWAFNQSDLPKPGNMYYETFCRLFPRNSLFRMELVSYPFWKKVGFHDLNLKIYEDYEMRVRLSKEAKINYTLEPLAWVRMDSHQLSKAKKAVHLKAFQYIYQKHYQEVVHLFPEKENEIKQRFATLFKRLQSKKQPQETLANRGLRKIKGEIKKIALSLGMKL